MDRSMLRHAAWIARSLGRGDLFPFTDADISELAATIGVSRLPAGTRLLGAGKLVEAVSIVEDGEIEVYHRAGVRKVVLQVLREGDLLGDLPFFCHMESPYSARALTDVTLIRLDGDQLERLLSTRPVLCRRFLYSLASRIERMTRRLLGVTQGDLRRQVSMLLLDETEERGPVLSLPQSTIAELLGATRPSVNRVLKQLEAEALVRLSYRRIEVLDRPGLAVEMRP
ncbi:MAG: Crp/Fnr family transcriptional regulator [Actinobacteria bacterium]|nr:Crp/Fnr family transcriptional regulator [Actinomycetota bacterium]